MKHEFCKNGHELALTRHIVPSGRSYCKVCKAEKQGSKFSLKVCPETTGYRPPMLLHPNKNKLLLAGLQHAIRDDVALEDLFTWCQFYAKEYY